MGHLLGFVVSKDGIWIDPFKIAAIINLPAPTNILELQMIDLDAIFGNHKAKQMSRLNEKNTFMRIEPYIIMTAPQEYVSKMTKMALSSLWMIREVIKVWFNNMFNVVKHIGHRTLERGSNIFQAER